MKGFDQFTLIGDDFGFVWIINWLSDGSEPREDDEFLEQLLKAHKVGSLDHPQGQGRAVRAQEDHPLLQVQLLGQPGPEKKASVPYSNSAFMQLIRDISENIKLP